MNIFRLNLDRMGTRSIQSSVSRIGSVIHRYGWNEYKFVRYVKDFISLTEAYGITPTFPVPGAIVKKYGDVFRELQDAGAVFAAHGFVHVDYSRVSSGEFMNHLAMTKEAFSENRLVCNGFRFPFFRKRPRFHEELAGAGFTWDSSDVLSFPLLSDNFSKGHLRDYERIKHTYEALEYHQCTAMPVLLNGLVEIPAGVPDDDMLVERLGILSQTDERWNIWQNMFETIYKDGSMLVLQAHPERFNTFKEPLRRLIENAAQTSNVWMASMDEVAQWWKVRRNTEVFIQKGGRKRYRVIVKGDERVRVLVKNLHSERKDVLYMPEYSPVKQREFSLVTSRKPIVGIHPGAGRAIQGMLDREGIVWEESAEKENYNYFIPGDPKGAENDCKTILRNIEECPQQLIRIWKWPEDTRAALVITGDIDGLTMREILMRNYGKGQR